ncbi:uncharacterized protein G2W53_028193 [Senna tora]|uniref:Uncharacterized protein n=1 Tax=Senna tora TaxID=362788 RepID=A0A834T1T3_9FABA|nr:uncharacterized protein G2W53_028193 [Senna tora]
MGGNYDQNKIKINGEEIKEGGGGSGATIYAWYGVGGANRRPLRVPAPETEHALATNLITLMKMKTKGAFDFTCF